MTDLEPIHEVIAELRKHATSCAELATRLRITDDNHKFERLEAKRAAYSHASELVHAALQRVQP